MKTAIVYDRVNKWGGAEQVLLSLHELFPDAPLYTSVYDSSNASWANTFPEIIPSFLNRYKYLRNKHEWLAPLMPLAFESFNFDDYDLVISVTSEAAKGVITKPSTLHVCYCLTPTRYLWSGYDDYFKSTVFKWISNPVVKYLRSWDKIAAQRPDHMIAISSAVKDRIKKYYGRESEIIHPPVDTNRFKNLDLGIKRGNSSALAQNDDIQEYYLIVSRLVSYKKVDLAIKAFNQIGKRLVIVGSGREEKKLRLIAKENVEFLGFVSDQELVEIYSNAKAFIFPQEEDFGITAVEAQASGIPVIAYSKGGSEDTIKDKSTGLLFNEQTSEKLISIIEKFEKHEFDRNLIKRHSMIYSDERFKRFFKSYINKAKSSG